MLWLLYICVPCPHGFYGKSALKSFASSLSLSGKEISSATVPLCLSLPLSLSLCLCLSLSVSVSVCLCLCLCLCPPPPLSLPLPPSNSLKIDIAKIN